MKNKLTKMKCNLHFYDKSGELESGTALVEVKDNLFEVEFNRFEYKSKNEYSGIVSVFSEKQKEGDVGIEDLLMIIELAGSKRFDSSITAIRDITILS